MHHQVGDYRLDHLIGEGATGEVWLAWEEGALHRPVAVKRVRLGGGPRATADLAAEAELLAGIHHPHLVTVIAVVDDGDDLAIVMPYLAGGSLAVLLEERGTMSPGEVVAVLEPLADAVDALTRRGMVHGDLKPGNVMLTGDGEPVLVDVGIARVAQGQAPRPEMAGTPEYLDPAVAQGHERGPASEVYALGVMAYECLTGRVPHRGEPAELVAMAGAGVHRRLHSWPTVPETVADVVESALDPDPSRRPGAARGFAALLRAAVVAHGAHQDEPEPITLPGIACRAIAAPDMAAGHHTVVIDAGPTETVDIDVASQPPPWRRLAVAVGVAAALGLIAVGADRSTSRASDDAPLAEPGPTPPSAAATDPEPEPECHPQPVPMAEPAPFVAAEESVVRVQVDVDGDGCADLVRWDGRQLTVTSTGASDERAYRLGRPGDQILFGDWDGDGATTPALYRPTTGDVLYVDRFPAEIGDREAAARVEHLEPHGIAAVQGGDGPEGGPHDRVVLADPS